MAKWLRKHFSRRKVWFPATTYEHVGIKLTVNVCGAQLIGGENSFSVACEFVCAVCFEIRTSGRSNMKSKSILKLESH